MHRPDNKKLQKNLKITCYWQEIQLVRTFTARSKTNKIVRISQQNISLRYKKTHVQKYTRIKH